MKEERGIIDRFEGDLAVVEINGQTMDIPRSELPEGAKSGDSLIFEEEKIRLDEEDTKKRKAEIKRLMDELFE